MMDLPICMAEKYWRYSQLSIARFYGGFTMNGKSWVLVGQTSDLVRQDFVKYYRKLGRNTFVEILKENGYASDKELLAIFKEMVAKKKKEVEHKDLFEQ